VTSRGLWEAMACVALGCASCKKEAPNIHSPVPGLASYAFMRESRLFVKCILANLIPRDERDEERPPRSDANCLFR
jgi:hypothetical protein